MRARSTRKHLTLLQGRCRKKRMLSDNAALFSAFWPEVRRVMVLVPPRWVDLLRLRRGEWR